MDYYGGVRTDEQLLEKPTLRRGETLLEVIVAISVLMIVLGPASGLFVASVHTVGQNRNDLVAAALAEEGIEMVRNMRDSNFMQFSTKVAQCWNAALGTPAAEITIDNCNLPASKIGDESKLSTAASKKLQYFRLLFDPATLAWNLAAVPASPATFLAEPEVTPPVLAASGDTAIYQLWQDPVTSLYFTTATQGAATPNATPNIATLFYRQIVIEYLDLDLAPPSAADAMRITSLVQYQNGGQLRNLKRVLILTNQPLL